MSNSPSEKTCILGAGSSGLAVAKNFRQRGIPFDCLEREDEIGGNWCYGKPHSSVYRSTRLISSKRETEYTDFPMPAHWPQHPPHPLVLQYLRSYARHFDLYRDIQFETTVERLEPIGDDAQSGWLVTLATGELRRYRGVVVANGHNWDPRWPEFPGQFSGPSLHSAEYKTPDEFRGRRVLVVGGGNSGFDISVDVAPHAQATFHSLRRGYPVLPRFLRGVPIDQCGQWAIRWRIPVALRRIASKKALGDAWSPAVARHLPRADHRLYESHPVINSRWPYEVAAGRVHVKPNVARLAGDKVAFADGSSEALDAIIYATGYKISFPFLGRVHLNWQGDRPGLYLNIFHPRRDDLFVAGMIQPDSGQFGLVDYQAQLIAAFVSARDRGTQSADWFRRLKERRCDTRASGGIRYVASPRHAIEVEHHSYRRRLRTLLAKLERS